MHDKKGWDHAVLRDFKFLDKRALIEGNFCKNLKRVYEKASTYVWEYDRYKENTRHTQNSGGKRAREKKTKKMLNRIQEEAKTSHCRCCCRRGGLFDPLSLFPPDLSRGHAYRVFFNREIHEADLSLPATAVRDLLDESISL